MVDCRLFLYWKYLRHKLVHIMSYAEEQISSIILVPVLSYFVLEFSVYNLKTYGIVVMSVEPGVFNVAFLTMVSFLAVYILMYWAIFKAVVVSASSAKVKAELDVASQIQLSALPSKFPAFPKHHDFDIYASMKPAKEVGGDFYDFFLVDDDHLAVLVADVSGKGVPAALFMMSGRAVIHNQAMLGSILKWKCTRKKDWSRSCRTARAWPSKKSWKGSIIQWKPLPIPRNSLTTSRFWL